MESGMDKKECMICKRPADCQHFGAQSCRSCASFFRRAVLSKRQYRCLRSNQCTLSKNPRQCKACRLAACRQYGMKSSAVQSNRDPLGPKNMQTRIPNLPSNTITQTSIAICDEYTFNVPKLNDPNLQSLNNLYIYYHEFEHAERALYALLFPEFYSFPPTYRAVIHTDFIKVERGTMNSTNTLIEQWLPLIGKQSSEFKSTLLRSFFPKFSVILKLYRTSKVYPDPDDTRIVLAYGQFERLEDSDYHYQHNKNPEEAKRHCMGFRLRTRVLSGKFRDLDITCAEMIAMSALLLSNEVEILLGNHAEIDEFRHKIYSDLHNLCKFEHRIGFLECLLVDAETLRRQINEAVTLLKLFSPHRVELFDD